MLVEQLKSLSEFVPVRRDDARGVLSAIPGVKLQSSHHGTFVAGKVRAELSRHTSNELQLTGRATRTILPQQALELNRHLPANLRFAIGGDRLALLANILVQPLNQLEDKFAELGRGLAVACGQSDDQSTLPASEDVFTTQQLVNALHPLGWEDQSVVELATGWELRPVVAQRPVAIKLTVDGAALRFHHVVVARVVGAPGAAAVYDQALRLNWQFRHARLALASGQIVAEACLRRGLFLGLHIAGAARAVAFAAHHACSALDILNTHPDIAACYVAMFCCEAVGDEPFVAG